MCAGSVEVSVVRDASGTPSQLSTTPAALFQGKGCHEHAQDVGLADRRRPPSPLENLVVGENLALVVSRTCQEPSPRVRAGSALPHLRTSSATAASPRCRRCPKPQTRPTATCCPCPCAGRSVQLPLRIAWRSACLLHAHQCRSLPLVWPPPLLRQQPGSPPSGRDGGSPPRSPRFCLD